MKVASRDITIATTHGDWNCDKKCFGNKSCSFLLINTAWISCCVCVRDLSLGGKCARIGMSIKPWINLTSQSYIQQPPIPNSIIHFSFNQTKFIWFLPAAKSSFPFTIFISQLIKILSFRVHLEERFSLVLLPGRQKCLVAVDGKTKPTMEQTNDLSSNPTPLIHPSMRDLPPWNRKCQTISSSCCSLSSSQLAVWTILE